MNRSERISFSGWSLSAIAAPLLVAAAALGGCSGSSSSKSNEATGEGDKPIYCCIIQTLISVCPNAYDATATSIAHSGNETACQSWLDDTSEGPDGRSCVNGLGTPIETVEQATASCAE